MQKPSHLCNCVFPDLTKYIATTAILILLFVCPACNDQPEGSKAEQIMRAKEGGDFRGINIGDDRELVKKMEDAKSVYSMPDEIVYRIDPEGDDSTWYEISYNFNQEGLYDISLEIFPEDDSGVGILKNDFANYYMKKYGECKYYNGYCQWRAMTENGHIVSITLSDSVSHAARPCLKVNFNESDKK